MSQFKHNFVISMFVIIFANLYRVQSSRGDRDPIFTKCFRLCDSSCSEPSQQVTMQSLDEKMPEPRGMDLLLRLLQWTCSDNCRYDCMHLHSAKRVTEEKPILQYFGKWPFKRVLGMQELFSVIFSLANLLPHAYFLKRYYADYRARRPFMAYTVRIYSLSSVYAWFWSAVFHARDTWLTERLDYCTGAVAILSSLAVAVVMWLGPRGKRKVVFVALGSAGLCHVLYMTLVRFDYTWHVIFGASTLILQTALWCTWTMFNPRPFNWKILSSLGIMWAAASFELFDFPPFFGPLDAHALWHGCTPVCSILSYSFLVDDAKYQTVKQLL
eukprot:134402_1